MNITEKLLKITTELKAPKNQLNKFGGYKYRSAEDILEALKPHLKKQKCVLKMHDKLKIVGEFPYIEATAKLIDCEEPNMQIESSAQAVLDFNAKGMQHPQRTGAASSYAKKYAIGNLFLLDDTKDSDATNQHNASEKDNNKPLLSSNTQAFVKASKYIKDGGDITDIMKKYRITKETEMALLATN
jgi:hypothetical protein